MSNGQKKLPLQRLSKSGIEIRKESVVEELAIQLTALDKTGEVYCHTTLLATPTDLIELHMGHLYAEGYLDEVPLVDHFSHSFETHHIVHYDSLCSQPTRSGIVIPLAAHVTILIFLLTALPRILMNMNREIIHSKPFKLLWMNSRNTWFSSRKAEVVTVQRSVLGAVLLNLFLKILVDIMQLTKQSAKLFARVMSQCVIRCYCSRAGADGIL